MAKFARTLVVFAMILYACATPITQKSPAPTILNMMIDDPNVCKFPSPEILQNASDIASLAPCAKLIPHTDHFGPGVAGIQQYALEVADRYAFLCMGFYDLSIRICHSDIPKESLVNDSDELSKLFDDPSHDKKFCEQIGSVTDSSILMKNTSSGFNYDWVQVLNENLAREEDCQNLCIRKRKVIPICRMLLWGRTKLHNQLTEPKHADLRTVAVAGLNFEQTSREPMLDLEAKDVEVGTEEQDISAVKQFDSETPSAVKQFNSEPVSAAVPTHASVPPPAEDLPPEQPKAKLELTPAPNKTVTTTKAAPTLVIIPKSDNSSKSSEEKSTKEVTKPSFSVSPTGISSTSSTSVVSHSTLDMSQPLQPETENTLAGIEDSGDIYVDANRLPDDATSHQERGDADLADDDDDDDPMGNEGQLTRQSQKEFSSVLGGDTDSQFHSFNSFRDAEDSHFFAYFLTLAVICIIAYLVFHNKNKILALALEGRKNGSRGGRSSRRPSTSSYRKLDSTLEEAISSSAPRTNPHVIY